MSTTANIPSRPSRVPSWREIVALAIPVVVSKLSFTAMGLVDTAMVGRLGAVSQGAVGLAHTWIFTLGVLGLGLLSVVNTYVAQNHGANRPQECGRVLGQGVRVAVLVGGATMILLFLSLPMLGWMGQGAGVADLASIYASCRLVGFLGVFGYWVYNGYLEGLGHTRTPMVIAILSNLVNIVLDWVLIFGVGPFPAMGVAGAGLATALSNLFMLAAFVVVVHRPRSPYTHGFGAARIHEPLDLRYTLELMRTGIPMGMQFFLEVGAFMVFAIMIGWVSAAALAANQVTMRLMSVSFMTTWGLGVAATTLVGRYLGAGQPDLAQIAGRRTLLLGLGVTCTAAVVYVALAGPLSSLFTNDAEVLRLAVMLLPVAAVFQILDGVNMISYGALRGAGDTRFPMWAVGFMSWVVGIPLVWWLTMPGGLGVYGAWLGTTAMVAGMAALLWGRFHLGRWSRTSLVSAAK
jgi:multidrug resistance protein, MATE family